jgi:hypothetical protein
LFENQVVTSSQGNVIYAPNLNYDQKDSFLFSVSDGSLMASIPGIVLISIFSVNQPPRFIARFISSSIEPGKIVSITAAIEDVDETSALIVSAVKRPNRG